MEECGWQGAETDVAGRWWRGEPWQINVINCGVAREATEPIVPSGEEFCLSKGKENQKGNNVTTEVME